MHYMHITCAYCMYHRDMPLYQRDISIAEAQKSTCPCSNFHKVVFSLDNNTDHVQAGDGSSHTYIHIIRIHTHIYTYYNAVQTCYKRNYKPV